MMDSPMAFPGQTPGIDELLDQAGDAVARGDWKKAKDLAEAVLTQSTHHPEAELILRTVTRFQETEAAPNDPFFGSRDLRFMSVMFCDAVGSTRLAGQLGDATWRSTLERFRRRCARAVRRYDGYVHEATGDELLILFGYPRLREDDARRAVLAGLDIVSSIEAFAALLKQEHGIGFQVRVGIHTGRALIKERGRGTSPADEGGIAGGLVGEAAHIAKRVETAAEPNTVWVSDATRRIVERFFEFAKPPAGVKRLEIGHRDERHGAQGDMGRRPQSAATRSAGPVGRDGRAARVSRAARRAVETGAILGQAVRARDGPGRDRQVQADRVPGRNRRGQ